MKKEELIEKIDWQIIKEGFVVNYIGEITGHINDSITGSTACFEDKEQLNRIYTEGVNYGLNIAKGLIK